MEGASSRPTQLLTATPRQSRGDGRGTFANVRPAQQKWWTSKADSTSTSRRRGNEHFEASEKYTAEGVPLVILAGKEYGSGSSRDWAGERSTPAGRLSAVIAESYERIHRSNLVGMVFSRCNSLEARNAGVSRPDWRRKFSKSKAFAS